MNTMDFTIPGPPQGEMKPFIFAIDPGNIESGWAILDEILKPIEFGKTNNETLLEKIITHNFKYPDAPHFAIEMVAHYGTGMPAGKTVFDTCVWIGRFWQTTGYIPHRRMIYRKDEKITLCGNMKAKDANISQALRDRFGEKGTKKNPGWFYGVGKDVWTAIAVGVCYHDMYLKN